MSANKPKQQEINRKPLENEDEFEDSRKTGERSEQRHDQQQGVQDKNKNKGGDFEKR